MYYSTDGKEAEKSINGAGAGELPTASAVVADIMDIASDRDSNSFGVSVSDLSDSSFLSCSLSK